MTACVRSARRIEPDFAVDLQRPGTRSPAGDTGPLYGDSGQPREITRADERSLSTGSTNIRLRHIQFQSKMFVSNRRKKTRRL